jgi:Caspase domain
MNTTFYRSLIIHLILVLTFALIVQSAPVEKIGIFIGNDYGMANERPLKYASGDALHMARLLQSIGGLDQDRTYLLLNSKIERIRSVLTEVSGRIKELHRTNIQTMLFLYYSGHGSSGSLHFYDQKMNQDELSEYLDSLKSDLKIVVVDACESGDLLRQKGGKLVASPQVEKIDQLRNRGQIIISSSSPGELSQESEDYQGSIFSHHFMNGLRGLADYNRDNFVGIMEACNYAGISTRMENVSGIAEAQHPLFDFDIVGQSDIYISDLHTTKSRVLFKSIPAPYLEVHDAYNMNLVTRVYLNGRDSVSYLLQSNKYICTFTDESGVYSKQIDLTWGKNIVLAKENFIRHPRLALYVKGGKSQNTGYHGAYISSRLTMPVLDEEMWLFQTNYLLRRYYTIHGVSIGYSSKRITDDNAALSNNLTLVRVAYSLKVPLYRFVYGQIMTGGEVAFHRAYQTISDLRMQNGPLYVDGNKLPSTYDYKATIYQAGLPIEIEVYLPFQIWLSVSLSGSVYRYNDFTTGNRTFNWAIEPGFSIGHQF